MDAREHAEHAAACGAHHDLQADQLKAAGSVWAMQAAQAHALTAIALAMTEPQETAAPEPTSFGVSSFEDAHELPADGDLFIHMRTGKMWRWDAIGSRMVEYG